MRHSRIREGGMAKRFFADELPLTTSDERILYGSRLFLSTLDCFGFPTSIPWLLSPGVSSFLNSTVAVRVGRAPRDHAEG